MAPVPEGKPSILVELVPDQKDSFVIQISFAGLDPGERVELAFIENDATADGRIRPERVLGTAAGTLVQEGTSARLSFVPDEVPTPTRVEGPRASFRFEAPGCISDFVYGLSADRLHQNEGDAWRVLVRADSHGIESPALPIARVRRQLEDGGATYDWHAGHELELYNDASSDARGEAGAFRDLLQAIDDAEHFIFVVDWSFHPLFCPSRRRVPTCEGSIGGLLIEKAFRNPNLLIAVHTWDHSMAGAADVPNDEGAVMLDLLAAETIGVPECPKNLLWRKTSRTSTGWSHHQKFVVLDAPGPSGRRELKAFWGGLDLTKGRFDWPEHLVDVNAPIAETFRTKIGPSHALVARNPGPVFGAFELAADDWYNPEFGGRRDLPRQPWHDIHGMLVGPAAWDFVREFVGRWSRVASLGGNTGDLEVEHVGMVWSLFRKLYEQRDTFIQQYAGKRSGRWSAQVYRSLQFEHWSTPAIRPKDALDQRLFRLFKKDQAPSHEHSIRRAYQRIIDQAERFIYIETQYFIGSGKLWKEQTESVENDLPYRIVRRIVERAKQRKPFHVYIVMPMFPEGDPVSDSNLEVRRNEWQTMQYMVTSLIRDLPAADKGRWEKYLSFYFLANWRPVAKWSTAKDREGRVRDHMRYMVYVHAKMILVDDRYILFGSCNLNERGLAGDRDSEIACGIWPSHGEEQAAIAIQRFRKRLWLEHLGRLPEGSDQPESCWEHVEKHGDRNYLNFRTMKSPPTGHICRLPLVLYEGKLSIAAMGSVRFPEGTPRLLPDCPSSAADGWRWDTAGCWYMRKLGLAE